MKSIFFLIIGFLLVGCKKDCCDGESIPDRPEFRIIDNEGHDLLSPGTPNSLGVDDIAFWTFKDEHKITLSTTIRERIRSASDTSFLVSFAGYNGEIAYMSNNTGSWEIFVQFRGQDTDTITWVVSGHEEGSLYTDEVRYNGEEIHMKVNSLEDYFTIQKDFE